MFYYKNKGEKIENGGLNFAFYYILLIYLFYVLINNCNR